MRKTADKLLLTLLLVGIIGAFLLPQPAQTAQEIKETQMLTKFLGENHEFMKKILRHSQEMQHQARPFTVKKHRERYRFEPGDKHPREIMVLARKMSSRFKLINGLVYHAGIPNRVELHDQFLETIDSMATFSKRAIRANQDYNYALYLASAQGIEKEVFMINELLHSLELAINANIIESDARKESL